MSKRRRIITAASVIVVLAVGLFVCWRTDIGRLVRGVSSFAIKNNSETPLRNVHVHLSFGEHGSITSRIDIIKPHKRVRVPAYQSGDLYVWRVALEHGQKTLTDDFPIRAKLGTTLEMVVDASGKISYAH